jgi:hypothetical protein
MTKCLSPHSTNSFVPTCDKNLHLHFGILHSMERRIAICVSILVHYNDFGCSMETTWTSHEENQIERLRIE